MKHQNDIDITTHLFRVPQKRSNRHGFKNSCVSYIFINNPGISPCKLMPLTMNIRSTWNHLFFFYLFDCVSLNLNTVQQHCDKSSSREQVAKDNKCRLSQVVTRATTLSLSAYQTSIRRIMRSIRQQYKSVAGDVCSRPTHWVKLATALRTPVGADSNGRTYVMSVHNCPIEAGFFLAAFVETLGLFPACTQFRVSSLFPAGTSCLS
jgi:hypothetical protein